MNHIEAYAARAVAARQLGAKKISGGAKYLSSFFKVWSEK